MTRSSSRSTSEKMHDWHNRFEMRLILKSYQTRHRRCQLQLEGEQHRNCQTLAARIRSARHGDACAIQA